jgi:hypothetical protein
LLLELVKRAEHDLSRSVPRAERGDLLGEHARGQEVSETVQQHPVQDPLPCSLREPCAVDRVVDGQHQPIDLRRHLRR